jgi:hypothetical protein
MPNLVEVNYEQTGKSKSTNELGMRDMQAKAYEARDAQYLLLSQITEDDNQKGYIYILKSLSNDDRISTKRNLYKIGFSTVAVETRIKNAKKDPTYLMADVQTISAYEVYNVNPHKLEQLIHKFFSNSCLDIDIVDENGTIHRPREWFIAPLEVIEEAVELIISGRIIDYRYDEMNEKISLR